MADSTAIGQASHGDFDHVLVVDFGAQYAQLIARRVREAHVYCEIHTPPDSVDGIKQHKPKGVILSGGPSSVYEDQAPLLEAGLADLDMPVLGVCLGHQALAAVFGSTVGAAQSLMHGKASPVYHDRRTIFEGLSNPFPAGRYHSLAVDEEGLGSDLMISAYTSEGEIMGVRHRGLPLEGVQFHPESLLTPVGERLLHNFLDLAPVVMPEPLKTSAI